MKTCRLTSCNNEVINWHGGRKYYCSNKCLRTDWLAKNRDRRLEHIKRYDRKMGSIPRSEWLEIANWRKENNPNWRGGTTQTYPYQKEEWKRLVVKVWKRDSFKCQHCSVRLAKGMAPQTHHIEPRRLGGPDTMANLVTLCRSCHAKIEWKTLSLRRRESWLA